jgi:3-oxoacyl-[acyl-carrier protein] reductase
MDLGLNGKRAVVAAASAGLGFATARNLLAAGTSVAICGRDADRVNTAVQLLGNNAIGVVEDISTSSGATRFMDQAISALGGIDILVTNGGGPKPGNDASIGTEDYAAALEANLIAMIAMCKEALPNLKEQQWGRIVAITSIAVRQPIPSLILSNTARSGLTAYLKTLAREVAPYGITVNSVQPGNHATDRMKQLYGAADPAAGIPVGKLGDPDDFGAVVAFVCSEQAKFITGAHIPVDGGVYGGLL